jgi:hypothetical protein
MVSDFMVPMVSFFMVSDFMVPMVSFFMVSDFMVLMVSFFMVSDFILSLAIVSLLIEPECIVSVFEFIVSIVFCPAHPMEKSANVRATAAAEKKAIIFLMTNLLIERLLRMKPFQPRCLNRKEAM